MATQIIEVHLQRRLHLYVIVYINYIFLATDPMIKKLSNISITARYFTDTSVYNGICGDAFG